VRDPREFKFARQAASLGSPAEVEWSVIGERNGCGWSRPLSVQLSVDVDAQLLRHAIRLDNHMMPFARSQLPAAQHSPSCSCFTANFTAARDESHFAVSFPRERVAGGVHFVDEHACIGSVFRRAQIEFNQEVEDSLPIINDSLISELSSKTFEEVYTAEGKEQIREEIVTLLNEKLADHHIMNVYFTEFVVQ